MRKLEILIVSFSICLFGVLGIFIYCESYKIWNGEFYRFNNVQQRTAIVEWNTADCHFQSGNQKLLEEYSRMAINGDSLSMPGCTSWRNGDFHGRNLDWYQGDYGCLVIKMKKRGRKTHASIGLINGNHKVSGDFIKRGVLNNKDKWNLPLYVVDGINDAGVVINMNIVPHQPGERYVGEEVENGISCMAVCRLVLDFCSSVDEAVDELSKVNVIQNLVPVAGDDVHYMISDSTKSAVVEFPDGKMEVTYYIRENGFRSAAGNAAILTNFLNCRAEEYGVGTDAFFSKHPNAMGVERWQTVNSLFDKAAESYADNIEIAQQVWYFKGLFVDRKPWYTENSRPDEGYGCNADGWYYTWEGEHVKCATKKDACVNQWIVSMPSYWESYYDYYGSLSDPHVKGNKYWETVHTVIYDLRNKVCYLIPFEGRYAKKSKPIIIGLN